MPTCEVFHDGRSEIVADIKVGLAAARETHGFVWVELDHPQMRDFSDVEETLGLHPLAVEDAVHARDRPKLDTYERQHFVSLTTLRRTGAGRSLQIGRVMAFVGEAFVVTVRQEDGDTLQRARRRLSKAAGGRLTPLDVLHALVDTVVEDLAGVSRQVENVILATADRLFTAQRSDESYELYQITRQLLVMAHAVQPLIEPLRHLSTGLVAGVELEEVRKFQDVLDHAVVLDREVSDHRELVEHLRGSNDARIGLQQNTDMRKIAAWAAVIAVPTAVTGFYGMNVPYPGHGAVGGAVAAVAIQAVLVLVLFLVFRHRGWL